MELTHCIYCSASSEARLGPAELEVLLEECRAKNAAAGVTGMLLYQEGSFFQVLEGPRTVVDDLVSRISADKRHVRVTKIIQEPITARAFGDWTMGHPKVEADDLAKIPGLNEFFLRGMSYMDIGEGRAKSLLAAFREGRWRKALA